MVTNRSQIDRSDIRVVLAGVVELSAEVVHDVRETARPPVEMDPLNRERRLACVYRRDDTVVLLHAVCTEQRALVEGTEVGEDPLELDWPSST